MRSPATDPVGPATDGLTRLLDRLCAAGISEARARSWVDTGGTRVDGEVITDPDCPAPPPARIVLHPG